MRSALTGVARIAIRIRSSFLVTIHTPLHIISVNHSHRRITPTGEPVTGGAIDLVLDVDQKMTAPSDFKVDDRFVACYLPPHPVLGPIGIAGRNPELVKE